MWQHDIASEIESDSLSVGLPLLAINEEGIEKKWLFSVVQENYKLHEPILCGLFSDKL